MGIKKKFHNKNIYSVELLSWENSNESYNKLQNLLNIPTFGS